MTEIEVVVHDLVLGRLEELDHRRVAARVVAQPDLALADGLQPLEQGQQGCQSVAHRDDDGELLNHDGAILFDSLFSG